MKIESIGIYNYRSLIKIERLKISDFDIFIGKNDSGKSSILNALNSFFNVKEEFNFEKDGLVKSDLSNKSIYHTDILETGLDILNTELGILVEFKLNENDYLNTDNLYIRSFINDDRLLVLKKGSDASTNYFIQITEPEDEKYSMLGDKKNAELKEIFEERRDIFEEFMTNENSTGKPTNSEYITAIILGLKNTKTPFRNRFIESKDIFKEKIFPSFTLIESHGSIDGSNKIIDSAFKIASDKIVDTHKRTEEFKSFHKSIEGKYNQITSEICDYAKSKYLHDLVSIKANPIINFSVSKELLIQKGTQIKPSHFDNQGDGTKRRIMVAMLQTGSKLIEIATNIPAQETIPGIAENQEYHKHEIWAFDEPELHLHPGAQRDLFDSLKTFKDSGTQIICSTHSTVFVDKLNFSGTHLFTLKDDGTTEITSGISTPETIIGELGLRNSDIFFSNKLILVEGETEENAIPIFYKHIKGKEIKDDGIEIICTKGSDRLSEIAEVILRNFHNSYAIIDNDSKTKVQNLENTGRITYIGTIADFEDAFSKSIWLDILNTNFTVSDSTFTWTSQIIDELYSLINTSDKNKKLLKIIESRYKHEWINSHNGDTNFEKEFEKPKLGILLATTSISRNEIPQKIIDFINQL